MSFSSKIIDTHADVQVFYERIGIIKAEIFHLLLNSIRDQLTPDLPDLVWYPVETSNGAFYFKPEGVQTWPMNTRKSAANFAVDTEIIGVCTSLIMLEVLTKTFPCDSLLNEQFSRLLAFAKLHAEAYVINRICFEG